MKNLFIITFNVLKITFRKKMNIIVYLILPVAIILLVMLANQSNDAKIKIGINNKDTNGVIAIDFINDLKKQDKFKVQILTDGEIKTFVAEGKVDCVLNIPVNFDESVKTASVQKMEITSIKGQEATGWIQSYVNFYLKDLNSIGLASNGSESQFSKLYEGFKVKSLTIHPNIVKDESSDKSKTVQSIGFLIMFMLQGASSTAGLILKEKKEKTYFRILTTPVNSKIYLGGNILANLCIIAAQSALVIIASRHIFNINTGVPDLELFAILLLFGLVCVTLGILLVAFSNTSYQAGTMATLIIVPTCMISGCFWPISLMPKAMQNIAKVLPQTWALDGITQMQNGKNLLGIGQNIIVLIAFAVMFFLIGAFKMKNSKSVKSFI
ncbi:MAG TPA: ABC transporter permease [Clostridiaceae bacterium]